MVDRVYACKLRLIFGKFSIFLLGWETWQSEQNSFNYSKATALLCDESEFVCIVLCVHLKCIKSMNIVVGRLFFSVWCVCALSDGTNPPHMRETIHPYIPKRHWNWPFASLQAATINMDGHSFSHVQLDFRLPFQRNTRLKWVIEMGFWDGNSQILCCPTYKNSTIFQLTPTRVYFTFSLFTTLQFWSLLCVLYVCVCVVEHFVYFCGRTCTYTENMHNWPKVLRCDTILSMNKRHNGNAIITTSLN